MYVIKTSKGYVSQFNSQMMVVSHCDVEHVARYAKKFKTVKAAESWIKKHDNAGYGFSFENDSEAMIEPM